MICRILQKTKKNQKPRSVWVRTRKTKTPWVRTADTAEDRYPTDVLSAENPSTHSRMKYHHPLARFQVLPPPPRRRLFTTTTVQLRYYYYTTTTTQMLLHNCYYATITTQPLYYAGCIPTAVYPPIRQTKTSVFHSRHRPHAPFLVRPQSVQFGCPLSLIRKIPGNGTNSRRGGRNITSKQNHKYNANKINSNFVTSHASINLSDSTWKMDNSFLLSIYFCIYIKITVF